MRYKKDSRGDVVHCEDCGMYPAVVERHVASEAGKDGEWVDLCAGCNVARNERRSLQLLAVVGVQNLERV